MTLVLSLRKIFLGLCVLVFLGAVGPACADGKSKVFVSILPQKFFVEKVGGDLVDVDVLVMPGANPHMYEPSPRQMQALSGAKAFFTVGINLEEVWLPRFAAANGSMRIVETHKGVHKLPMEEHAHGDAAEEHHEEAMHEGDHDDHEDHHEHGILDPHIWLDPLRARAMAENICAGLIAIDPANRRVYEANLAVLDREIVETHKAIEASLASVSAHRRTFMVFHPSWGYFAARYNLTQVAIEAQGNEPGPRHLAEIISHGRELGLSVVFVQPQFSRKSASVIASELEARVVPLDPLAEDWEDNLLRAAAAFGKALK